MDYNGDLDLASVVLYLNDFRNITREYDVTVTAFQRELDISLGNIYIGQGHEYEPYSV